MIAHSVDRRGILMMTAILFLPLSVARSALAEPAVLTPVHQLIEGLLRIMKAGHGTPFPERFDILAPVIDKTFDLSAILKQSVGIAWDTLPADQQEVLLKAFRRYTVASYVNSFDDYDGQHFVVNPETRIVGDEQVVRTQIVPTKGEGHELDYVMRQNSTGWSIVDVLADGAISRVAVQRSDFRRLIRQGGALALSESLGAKSANLSN